MSAPAGAALPLLPDLLPAREVAALAAAAVSAAAVSAAAVGAGAGRLLRGGVDGGRHGRAVPVQDDLDRVGEAEVLAAQVVEGLEQPVGQEGEQVVAHVRHRR